MKRNAKLEKFIKLCAYGHSSHDAAAAVGFKPSTGETYRSRHKAEISQKAIERLQSDVPDAVEAISQLRHDKSGAVRLAAANRTLEAAGHGVVHKQEVVHKSDDDLVQALLQAFNGDRDTAVRWLKDSGAPIPAGLQSQAVH